MRRLSVIFWLQAGAVALLLSACGNRMSSGDLQRKLDSVKSLEQVEMLKLQGIQVGESDPLQVFLDSLSIQTLPVRYDGNTEIANARFTAVPDEVYVLLGLNRPGRMKAIMLPDVNHHQVLLFSGDDEMGSEITYLYTLKMNTVADSLCLSDVRSIPTRNPMTGSFVDCSITNDYTIHLVKYERPLDADKPKFLGEVAYLIDGEGMFVEQPSLSLP